MVRVLGHRQTKGAATDHPSLPPPRHISTLQTYRLSTSGGFWPQPAVYEQGPVCAVGQAAPIEPALVRGDPRITVVKGRFLAA
jgi:hypothetical protein